MERSTVKEPEVLDDQVGIETLSMNDAQHDIRSTVIDDEEWQRLRTPEQNVVSEAEVVAPMPEPLTTIDLRKDGREAVQGLLDRDGTVISTILYYSVELADGGTGEVSMGRQGPGAAEACSRSVRSSRFIRAMAARCFAMTAAMRLSLSGAGPWTAA